MSPRIKLLLLALACVACARAETKVGDPLLTLENMKGGVPIFADGKNPQELGTVKLVDFWASWCAPCKASFPAMKKLHADYASRGFAIIAVSVDEKLEAAQSFWKKMDPPFMGMWDRDHHLVDKVNVPTMPTSYLLGRDGRVRFIHVGFHGDETEKELRHEIEILLAEKS